MELFKMISRFGYLIGLAFVFGLATCYLGTDRVEADDQIQENLNAHSLFEDEGVSDSRFQYDFKKMREPLELRDLEAQESMAYSTMWMAALSFPIFLVGLAGTILLGWTLKLTMEANKTAQSAVNVNKDILKKQTRAYLSIESLSLITLKDERGFAYALTLRNFGNSPAEKIVCEINFQVSEYGKIPFDYVFTTKPIAITYPIISAGSAQHMIVNSVISRENLKALISDKVRVHTIGKVNYVDTFGDRQSFTFRV